MHAGADTAPDPSAVLAAFRVPGRAVDMVAVPNAWSNRVYRLTTDRHQRFAVKELRNPWDDPDWRDWLDAAWDYEQRAFDAGVRMPEPIPNPTDGGCLAWVERKGEETPAPVRMHVWVDGSTLEHEPVPLAVARWAGQTLAVLHQLGVKPANRALFPTPNTDVADRWSELVQSAYAARLPWARRLDEVEPTVQTIADLVRSAGHQPEREVMSHGDIDQKNLLISPDGPVLCDWDVAAPLVPQRELADAAMSLANWERLDIAHEVVHGYRAGGGECACIRAADLGPSMMSGLDWLAFNVDRATRRRPATAQEAALSAQLVSDLLERLPARVELAMRVEEILTP